MDSNFLHKDFAVVTCFFNFSKNKFRERAYAKFAGNLSRQGVELFSVELIYDKEPAFLPPSNHVLHLHSSSVLWSKENLLNILISKLPKRIKKIAWIDADVIIEDDGWATRCSEILDSAPIVQIGSIMEKSDRSGKIEEARIGIAMGYERNHKHFLDDTGGSMFGKINTYHPGFAWAATREFLSEIKLFEYDLVGGADTFMFFACISIDAQSIIPHFPQRYDSHHHSYLSASQRYINKAYGFVKGNVKHVPAIVVHIWHGWRKNKGLATRHEVTRLIDFNKDLKRNHEGLLMWEDMEKGEPFKEFILKQNEITEPKKPMYYDPSEWISPYHL